GQTRAETRGQGDTGDARSHYFSVKVFGLQAFGPVAVHGAAGWMRVAGKGQDLTGGRHVRADVFTADLGAMATFKAGCAAVTPYAQAQVTLVSPENFTGGRPDDTTAVQWPVGVRAAAELEAGGWKLSPMLDAAVVMNRGSRAMGWKKDGAEHSTRIAERTVMRGKAGITATSGKGALGLTYTYARGTHGSYAHAVTASGVYTF
ncbi:MAG: autotransporter domain-containing protein, partial [Duodenibacillus sp.]|nr:autotransporter domain-containing protein [Duodenibacillus sp.]